MSSIALKEKWQSWRLERRVGWWGPKKSVIWGMIRLDNMRGHNIEHRSRDPAELYNQQYHNKMAIMAVVEFFYM